MENTVLDTFIGVYFGELELPFITVYQNPTDFKETYVARLFNLQQPTEYVVAKNSLAEIRNAIPDSFRKIDRSPEDDPAIVEIWL
ncbi:hypothetical protein ACFDTO_13320 [Microbacteriaceae bacterium 4G12]